MTGRCDFNVAPSVAWAIHKSIPGAELAVFEKSGHRLFCEEPDAFLTHVGGFLSKGPPAGIGAAHASTNVVPRASSRP